MKTFLLSVAFASAAMFSGLALATQPGNNGGGNGGCGVGQQTNGCGAQGGAGGAGGTGGNGLGVGVGIANANAAAVSGSTSGAAVIGSGNSSVRNTNTQGQSQSSRNSNRNTAEGGRGGNAVATGGNSGGNTLTGGAVAVSVEGDKGDMVYAPAQERAPVATAYAAPLTSSPETCMGSSSGGAQGANFGVTFGTTWESAKCDRRMDARTLHALGYTGAAVSRMCQGEENVKAMEDAGTPCPTAKGKRAATAAREGEGFATAPQAQYQDPIIRARLGLPPLK